MIRNLFMSVSHRALPRRPNSSSFKETIPIVLLWYSITWKGMVIISSALQNEKAIWRMMPVVMSSSLLFHRVLLFPPALLSQFPLVSRAEKLHNYLDNFDLKIKVIAKHYVSSFKIFLNMKYFLLFPFILSNLRQAHTFLFVEND